MTFSQKDDEPITHAAGGMATVIVCDECGEVCRYTADLEFNAPENTVLFPWTTDQSFEDFTEEAIKDAEESHECGK